VTGSSSTPDTDEFSLITITGESISIVGNSFAQSLGSMEFFSGLKYDGAFADLSDSLST